MGLLSTIKKKLKTRVDKISNLSALFFIQNTHN